MSQDKQEKSIYLELPGFKIKITGIGALLIILIIIIVICISIVYLVSEKDRPLANIISSINPKTGVQEKSSEILNFWIPYNDNNKKAYDEFEKWLTENVGWWGKVRMTNTRKIKGKLVVVDGYMYSAEDPREGSYIKEFPEKAILHEAVQILKVEDLDYIWTEIEKRALK